MFQAALSYLGSFLGGVIIKHIWDKIHTRLTTLEYQITYVPLGLTESNETFGDLEVRHRGQPVPSLFMSRIEVINDGNRDLTNVDLDIACDQESCILVSEAHNTSSLKSLPFSSTYLVLLNNPVPQPLALRMRGYTIPVLNRGDKVQIGLLLTNSLKNQPFVFLTCDHPGLRLRFGVPQQTLLGVPIFECSMLGLAITLLFIGAISYYAWPVPWYVPASAVLGLMATVIGCGVLKVIKAIGKVLD
jgi:hypothetical protein